MPMPTHTAADQGVAGSGEPLFPPLRAALALNAGWDLEMLSLEIGELGEAGFDLRVTGFDEFELSELFAERTQGRTDPDDAGGARFGSRRCREPIRAFPCGPELRSSSGKGLSEAALSGPIWRKGDKA